MPPPARSTLVKISSNGLVTDKKVIKSRSQEVEGDHSTKHQGRRMTLAIRDSVFLIGDKKGLDGPHTENSLEARTSPLSTFIPMPPGDALSVKLSARATLDSIKVEHVVAIILGCLFCITIVLVIYVTQVRYSPWRSRKKSRSPTVRPPGARNLSKSRATHEQTRSLRSFNFPALVPGVSAGSSQITSSHRPVEVGSNSPDQSSLSGRLLASGSNSSLTPLPPLPATISSGSRHFPPSGASHQHRRSRSMRSLHSLTSTPRNFIESSMIQAEDVCALPNHWPSSLSKSSLAAGSSSSTPLPLPLSPRRPETLRFKESSNTMNEDFESENSSILEYTFEHEGSGDSTPRVGQFPPSPSSLDHFSR